MGGAGSRWRTVEHTADLAIEVEAPTLERLFVTAALGLTGVLQGAEAGAPGPRPNGPRLSRRLRLEAPDREALLVDWLRELLYIQLAEGVLLAAAEIEKLEETKMAARAAFRRPTPESSVQRELKGVTYHDLELTPRGDGWYARIVFDL